MLSAFYQLELRHTKLNGLPQSHWGAVENPAKTELWFPYSQPTDVLLEEPHKLINVWCLVPFAKAQGITTGRFLPHSRAAAMAQSVSR